jgi:hypothetical protein
MRYSYIICTLFISYAQSLFGQYPPGFLPEFFFGRQPSARSEAMGKAYVSKNGDLGSIYFNPAGISNISKIEVNTSYAPPNHYFTKGYYTFFAVGVKWKNKLAIALSKYEFNLGKTIFANPTKTPFSKRYAATLAIEPFKRFYLGTNINLLEWETGTYGKYSTLYFDVGALKKIRVYDGKKTHHVVNIGSSISNINSAKIKTQQSGVSQNLHLPIITRYGINYEISYGKTHFIDSTNIFKILFQSEFQVLLNSKYRSAIKFGSEISILDFLSIRAGWYNEKVYDFGFPDDNNSHLIDFTYGIGIKFPIKLITKFPLTIIVDFTSLPQVSYSKIYTDWENFENYTLRLTTSLSSKK